jgi:hypothetical protein
MDDEGMEVTCGACLAVGMHLDIDRTMHHALSALALGSIGIRGAGATFKALDRDVGAVARAALAAGTAPLSRLG